MADEAAVVMRGNPVFMSKDDVLEQGFHEWNWMDEHNECWRLFDFLETVLID
jgi:hypothetical protein